jgi:phosphoesterase RecJ-like protein
MEALLEIRDLIIKEDEFIITSHMRPDGDSIATQIALALALKKLERKVLILNKDEVPYMYSFLPGVELIQKADEIPDYPKSVFYIECSDFDRPGLKINDNNHFIINIDHHITNTMFGDINWIDAKAPAAGAMIYDFIKLMNIELTKDIASNIFAAIASDTGGFRYNLYERTFYLCQEMVKAGIKAEEIIKNLYGGYPASRIRLLAEVLKTINFDANGKVVWIKLTKEMLQKVGADSVDCEGFIDYVLFIEGVEMALFFKQVEDNKVRVSLRSAGNIDVSPIARQFGGGGHKYASACTLPWELDVAINSFITSLKEFYKKELDL